MYLGLGRTMAQDFCRKIGAEIKIGKCCRFDINKIDAYLDNFGKEGNGADNQADRNDL